MGSLYLNRLSRDEYQKLVAKLWQAQNSRCFICENPIDENVHLAAGTVDVDHIMPLNSGGLDDPANFALAHDSCNRSKQASDLRIARLLARFSCLQEKCPPEPGRPNLSDVLLIEKGAIYDLPITLGDGCVTFGFPDLGKNYTVTAPCHCDPLSRLFDFFAVLPIEYLVHDDRINPRAIAGTSLRRLIEEFHSGLPQLHTALAWVKADGRPRTTVRVFDGQHKIAAQVLLGVREVPIRVFVNPNLDTLLTANTHAGTTLRQVAFDKSVQRRLGSQLFQDRIDAYLEARGLPPDCRAFSEQDLLDHFKGKAREVLRYILDDVRDTITHHPDNKLKSFMDFGGRSSELPLSYSSVEKTFYSFFICSEALKTPLDYQVEQGLNPRELEKDQILRLMSIIAEQIYIGQYDPAVGTYKLENKVAAGEAVDLAHLRAFRMGKEEILYGWLRLVRQLIQNALFYQLGATDEGRLLQYQFTEPLWQQITQFIKNIAGLPLWINRSLAETIFGGKQKYDYWNTIFATGRTPSGIQVLTEPINVIKLSAPS